MKSLLRIRELVISREEVRASLWLHANQEQEVFRKAVLIDEVIEEFTAGLSIWAMSERGVVWLYAEHCFVEMVEEGHFQFQPTGKGPKTDKYRCVHDQKLELITPQLSLPFHGSVNVWPQHDQPSEFPVVPVFEEEQLPSPAVRRIEVVVSRIVRDTPTAAKLKELYEGCCQVCGLVLDIGGRNYCEAHHLRPLGTPHDGPDVPENMMVLCPNHHVLFDYGVPLWHDSNRIEIGGETFVLEMRHILDAAHVHYYRAQLQLKRADEP